MSGHKPKIMCYWISENPDSKYPQPLNELPSWVDIVPLAFASITEAPSNNYSLNLTAFKRYPNLLDWIKHVRKNETKVILSINDGMLGTMSQEGIQGFVNSVMQTVELWQLDGLDLDYEPPDKAQSLVAVATALRKALLVRDPNTILTAPIYSAWTHPARPHLLKDILPAFASLLNYVTTMDYTPYEDLTKTMSLAKQYETAIGGREKLMIGVSCMGPKRQKPTRSNFTPLEDVQLYAKDAVKGFGGVMLYTFNYDVPVRWITVDGDTYDSGTDQPVNAWLNTIHAIYLKGN